MLKYSLLVLLAFTAVVSNGQVTTDSSFKIDRKFSVKELKQNLTTLKDSLEILHPALYRYTSKKSFDSLFRAAYENIDKPMSLSGFYDIIAPVMGKVGDIHTTLEFPDECYSHLSTKAELFPFDVRIINEDVFIASNNSLDSTIKVGAKILKINGQPVKKVLQKMKSYFSDEGYNTTLKTRRVEQRFAFQYYVAYGPANKFTVQYAETNQLPVTKLVSALPFSAIRENRAKNRASHPDLKPLFVQPPYLALSTNKEKQTAILTIKWFQNDVLQGSGEQFKPFIDSVFSAINKNGIKNLVIDIRRNEGGESENAAYLYSYLTNKPFRFLEYLETNNKTYADDRKRLVKYSFIKDSGKYRTMDSSMAAISSQFFGLNMQQPQINNFTGKVFVLVDGLTTSAAPQFVSLVRINKRGVIIGEEVPGALYGGCGRGYAYFYLPNTGILTMISLYRVGMSGIINKRRDITISPDHKVTTTMEDLLNGVDKEMQMALELVGSKK